MENVIDSLRNVYAYFGYKYSEEWSKDAAFEQRALDYCRLTAIHKETGKKSGVAIKLYDEEVRDEQKRLARLALLQWVTEKTHKGLEGMDVPTKPCPPPNLETRDDRTTAVPKD